METMVPDLEMRELEARLSGALREIATQASVAASPGDETRRSQVEARGLSLSALLPVLAAASVAVVLGVAALAGVHLRDTGGTEPPQVAASGSTSEPSVSTSSPALEYASAEVDGYVAPLIEKFGRQLQVSALWDEGELLIAAKPPIPDGVASLDGQHVGGLTIAVRAALYSPADYEAAIASIGRANFPGRDSIDSYNLPPDCAYVEVRVRGLHDMSPAARQALSANITAASGVAVKLTAPIPTFDFDGTTSKGGAP